MCSTSAILDWGRTVPLQQWTQPAWVDFTEVLRRLEEIDRKLNQPDCEDPAKATWMREVEKRLEALEA